MQELKKKGGQSGHKAEDRHLNIFAIECTAVIIIDCILPKEINSKVSPWLQ